MFFNTVAVSEARKNLPKIIKEIDQKGKIFVLTTHGSAKVALIDLNLLEEFLENREFGITEEEILARSKEKTISLKELKKNFDVQC